MNRVLQKYSNDVVRYEVGSNFRETGKLNVDNEGCWSYIVPTSVQPDTIILHGEGGIYLNPNTLEVGRVFWLNH